MFIFLLMIFLCFTEQQSWRLCPHSLWQVWPPWPWPWLPSAPPSIFFSTWRFSDLQAPAAAKTLLLDPTRLRAFTPGWQLQPRGVHEPLLVDDDQKLMGNDPFLALVAEDNNVETLKEAVTKKLKLRSGLRMMTQKKTQVMRRRRTRTERMKMTRIWSCFILRLHWM